MLVNLRVKNLALIEEEEIVFHNGLNILTGETGAGKSIIVGSVALALGAKVDKNIIRPGAEYALIELTFSIDNDNQINALQSIDIQPDEVNLVTFVRKISPNKSTFRINGETFNMKQVRDVATKFVDIHGQSEYMVLKQQGKYLELLDDSGGSEFSLLKTSASEAYRKYMGIKKQFDKLINNNANRDREISLARFEIEEIESINPIIGEDEQLEEEYKILSNCDRIRNAITNTMNLMSMGDNSAMDSIGQSIKEIRSVSGVDNRLINLEEQLLKLEDLGADIVHYVSDYIDTIDYSDEELYNVENRLNSINHIKSKYGRTISEVIEHKNVCIELLEKYDNYEEKIVLMKEELAKAQLSLMEINAQLHKERVVLAKRFTEAMIVSLKELNFKEIAFDIEVEYLEGEYTENGSDKVDYKISANPGEPMQSVCNVASGGELSRIMLAIKTLVADRENISTIIFDEIDAGISGHTAWTVGEKLSLLALKHQVICITHLQQIAAMSDSHYLIEKQFSADNTITKVTLLGEKPSLEEIARMLGGREINGATYDNARELKKEAKKYKLSILKD